VPIFHASLTPAGIRQCAEIADGWFPFLHSVDALRRDLSLVSEGLARAGRDRASFTVAPFLPVLIDDDVSAARELVRRHIAFYVGAMGRFYAELLRRHGFADAVDAARAEWAAGRRDAAARAISDTLVDEVAACGSATRVREQLDALRDAGADMPIAFLPLGSSPEQTAPTI